MELRTPLRSLSSLQGTAVLSAAQAASDVVLLLDPDGVIHDSAIRSDSFARELRNTREWRGRLWRDVVAPESALAVEALRAAAASGAATEWRHLLHRECPDRDVPMLCTAIQATPTGDVLVLGRDLLALDLLRVVLDCDPEATSAYVEALRARGTDFETLCLDVLAPAARRLGVEWAEDRRDFLALTEGTWRLQSAARALAACGVAETGAAAPRHTTPVAPRILLATVPGEQHVFGLTLLACFFVRAGWHVREELGATSTQTLDLLAREHFDVLALTAACESRLAAVPALIGHARRVSANRGLRVLIGGNALVTRPEQAAATGADGTAADARGAVAEARRLLATAVGDATGRTADPRRPRAAARRRGPAREDCVHEVRNSA